MLGSLNVPVLLLLPIRDVVQADSQNLRVSSEEGPYLYHPPLQKAGGKSHPYQTGRAVDGAAFPKVQAKCPST